MGKESKLLLISDDLLECQEVINYINTTPDIQLVSATSNILIWSMKYEGSIKHEDLSEKEGLMLGTLNQKYENPDELMDIRSAKLDEIGMKPSLIGRRYLLDALMLIDEGINKEPLCKMIASKYGKSQESVRGAMKRAIQTTWDSMPDDVL